MELSSQARLEVVQAKIAQYEQSAYSAELDARVAERLNDDRMRQAAAESLKRIEQAQDVLREELARVQEQGGAVGSDVSEGAQVE